jgi:hypothetical protein
MVRVGVCIYLMLTTLAGPGLCCCTVMRSAREVAPALRAERRPPASPSHRGCCCHRDTATPNEPLPDRGVPKPGSPGRPCPCRQGQSNPVPLPTPSSQLAPESLAAHASQPLPGPAPALPAAGLLSGEGLCTLGTAHDLPFLTAQDVLHTLHILRC